MIFRMIRLRVNDLAGEYPAVVEGLREKYEAWFADVCASGHMTYQHIWVGTDQENPVRLTRQDWRGERSRFVRTDTHGWWDLDVRRAGHYDVTVTFPEVSKPGTLHVMFGDVQETAGVSIGDTSSQLGSMTMPAGPAALETWLDYGDGKTGVTDAMVLFIGT